MTGYQLRGEKLIGPASLQPGRQARCDDCGQNNRCTTIQPSRKLALRNTILSVAKAILLASCASPPPTILHDTVGPAAAAFSAQHNGYLAVYSATAWTMADDDGPGHLTHTDYQINAANGNLFAQVTNGDEEPARMTLPNGNYTVVAQSDTAGTVTVPVAIEPGKLA